MIQRIQSLYLLAASILMSLMLVFPLANFLMDDHEFVLKAFAFGEVRGGEITKIAGTTFMGVLIALATLLPFITIFCFRNRILQIRLCFVELVLIFGVVIFAAYYLYHATTTVNAMGALTVAKKYSFVNIAPVVAFVLTWMANKRIMKDEALVRSMDRIR